MTAANRICHLRKISEEKVEIGNLPEGENTKRSARRIIQVTTTVIPFLLHPRDGGIQVDAEKVRGKKRSVERKEGVEGMMIATIAIELIFYVVPLRECDFASDNRRFLFRRVVCR